MSDSSGLSDVLRDMAEGQAPSRSTPSARPGPSARGGSARRPQPAQAARPTEPEDDDVIVGEMDEPDSSRRRTAAPVSPAAFDEGGATIAAAPRRRAPQPPPPSHTLQEVGACLFTTFGILMLLVAAWGTLILAGVEVWRHDQPGARSMAMVTQVFYLLAPIGIGYAVYLFVQVSRDKKQQKALASRRRR